MGETRRATDRERRLPKCPEFRPLPSWSVRQGLSVRKRRPGKGLHGGVAEGTISISMNRLGKTFRLFLVTAVALSTMGTGMAALACLCRGVAEHDGCHDATCPQASLLGHEDDTDACGCELGPVSGTHIVYLKSRKSRFSVGTRCPPSIFSVSWFSPSHLGTLGAMPGVVPRTAAQLLALRTVVLRL